MCRLRMPFLPCLCTNECARVQMTSAVWQREVSPKIALGGGPDVHARVRARGATLCDSVRLCQVTLTAPRRALLGGSLFAQPNSQFRAATSPRSNQLRPTSPPPTPTSLCTSSAATSSFFHLPRKLQRRLLGMQPLHHAASTTQSRSLAHVQPRRPRPLVRLAAAPVDRRACRLRLSRAVVDSTT